jgi:hypothetical protein
MLPSDLLLRRETQFTFWRPSVGGQAPVLVIGTFAAGNPNTLANSRSIPLSAAGPNAPGLWTVSADTVVVVANFSDYATPNGLTDPNAEYVVPNWPQTPTGRYWREVTQQRDVLPAQVGREPIFPWEAKVYTLA